MSNLAVLEPVDYLVIGHVAHDLTPDGWRLGGTAAYSALTAQALGLRVGIVTSLGPETSLAQLGQIPVVAIESPNSTIFENIYTKQGRVQYLRAQATRLDFSYVPEIWRHASIIHLGPIANEVDATLPEDFSPALLGMTPQGWMRQWDSECRVSRGEWHDADTALARAGAVVISREDVNGDDELIEHMAQHTRVLVVTESAAGSVLYWNGDRRRFRAPKVTEVDATGAGDVFAAAFFYRLLNTHDPWEATRFATMLASCSVTRPGLEGIATDGEVAVCMIEILP
ncbi:MAG TPA: PfkB family carbohydrate kinase [Anaerolineales bacterium]|jgi:sugar/nucleoside kinase (ribokinase family)|nr:PfkB family carbohydrate kinase [Anaerolineales bacterium]